MGRNKTAASMLGVRTPPRGWAFLAPGADKGAATMEIPDMTFSTVNLWVILVAAYFVWCVRCIIKERRTQREIRESLGVPD
jgi:hypothetical protein